jgi:hypothetical protein
MSFSKQKNAITQILNDANVFISMSNGGITRYVEDVFQGTNGMIRGENLLKILTWFKEKDLFDKKVFYNFIKNLSKGNYSNVLLKLQSLDSIPKDCLPEDFSFKDFFNFENNLSYNQLEKKVEQVKREAQDTKNLNDYLKILGTNINEQRSGAHGDSDFIKLAKNLQKAGIFNNAEGGFNEKISDTIRKLKNKSGDIGYINRILSKCPKGTVSVNNFKKLVEKVNDIVNIIHGLRTIVNAEVPLNKEILTGLINKSENDNLLKGFELLEKINMLTEDNVIGLMNNVEHVAGFYRLTGALSPNNLKDSVTQGIFTKSVKNAEHINQLVTNLETLGISLDNNISAGILNNIKHVEDLNNLLEFFIKQKGDSDKVFLDKAIFTSILEKANDVKDIPSKLGELFDDYSDALNFKGINNVGQEIVKPFIDNFEHVEDIMDQLALESRFEDGCIFDDNENFAGLVKRAIDKKEQKIEVVEQEEEKKVEEKKVEEKKEEVTVEVKEEEGRRQGTKVTRNPTKKTTGKVTTGEVLGILAVGVISPALVLRALFGKRIMRNNAKDSVDEKKGSFKGSFWSGYRDASDCITKATNEQLKSFKL